MDEDFEVHVLSLLGAEEGAQGAGRARFWDGRAGGVRLCLD